MTSRDPLPRRAAPPALDDAVAPRGGAHGRLAAEPILERALARADAVIAFRKAVEYARLAAPEKAAGRTPRGLGAVLRSALPEPGPPLDALAAAVRVPAVTLAELRAAELDASDLNPDALVSVARAGGLDRDTFIALYARDVRRGESPDDPSSATGAGGAPPSPAWRTDLDEAWDFADDVEPMLPDDPRDRDDAQA